MAPPISLLSSLTTQTDFQTILVRVTRMWDSINKRTNQLMYTNIVLLDEEGNHMLAIVRTNQKDAFLNRLAETNVYTITNFKVVPGPASYRTVDKELSVNFYYKTKIEQVTDTGRVPRYKFELKDFEEVPDYVGNVICLIDVVGMVITYGHLETRSNGSRKMDVVMTNARNQKMVVSLWESKAIEFQGSLAAAGKGALFAVVTGLLAKKFAGQLILSSTDATKTYINIDYSPLVDLRSAVLSATGKTVDTLPPPMAKRFVNAEDGNLQDLTIEGILEASLPAGTDVIRRACEATIVGIMEDQGWYYNCCPTCARKVRRTEETYFCDNCLKDASDFKPRYKLIVKVQDGSGLTTFTLFNKEAETLIGVPVETVIGAISPGTSMTDIPPIIKNIEGKKCAFDIKINAYNTERGYEEYTVYRLSECTPGTTGAGEKSHDGAPNKKLRTA